MADRSIVRYADLLDALEYDPYPSAPRLDPLKAILACSPVADTSASETELATGVPISGVSPSAIDPRKGA